MFFLSSFSFKKHDPTEYMSLRIVTSVQGGSKPLK